MKGAIGVIDSGVGGLTVVNEIVRQLPNESIVYLGDTERCPYGSRTETEIIKYTKEMVHHVLLYDLKILVIACNTATAYTLEYLKETLKIPVVGVIKPGSRAAISATTTKKIGIIGTDATINSRAYERSLKAINENLIVERLACPTFVPLIESGEYLRRNIIKEIEDVIEPLREKSDIDTLILGCTHYPLISNGIKKVMGKNVKVISSSQETAREVSVILDERHLLNSFLPRKHTFLMTGDVEAFKDIYKNIFNDSLTNKLDAIIKQVKI